MAKRKEKKLFFLLFIRVPFYFLSLTHFYVHVITKYVLWHKCAIYLLFRKKKVFVKLYALHHSMKFSEVR